MADLRVRSRRVRISARPAAQSANDTGSGDDALEGPGSRMKVYRSRGSRQNKSVGSQCNVVASAVDVTRAESSVRAQIRNVPCDIIRAGSKYRIQRDVRTSPVIQHRSTGVRCGGGTSRTAEPAAGGDLKSHGGDVLRIQQIVGVVLVIVTVRVLPLMEKSTLALTGKSAELSVSVTPLRTKRVLAEQMLTVSASADCAGCGVQSSLRFYEGFPPIVKGKIAVLHLC